MIFKQVEPSEWIGFLFGMWTIFLRKTLTCRIFVSSAPLEILVIWRARTSVMNCTDQCFEIQDFHFSESQNVIFKGLEPQNCAFSGNLRNLTGPKFCWVIWAAQTVKKNLRKSVLWCTQIKCHESGMSPSNSKKSYLDVQSLTNILSKIRFFKYSEAVSLTGARSCIPACPNYVSRSLQT